MTLFLGRQFHWRPEGCEAMDLDDLAVRFDDATACLKAEGEARRR